MSLILAKQSIIFIYTFAILFFSGLLDKRGRFHSKKSEIIFNEDNFTFFTMKTNHSCVNLFLKGLHQDNKSIKK